VHYKKGAAAYGFIGKNQMAFLGYSPTPQYSRWK
jgi:hypothetical protein